MKLTRISILIAVICLVNVPRVYSDNRTARITKIRGMVEVRMGSELAWREAKVGQTLTTQDKLRTKMGAYTSLVLPDGSAVELKENSVLDISRLTGKPSTGRETTKIKLWIGTVRANVEKLKTDDSVFEIQTPVAVCGVRGTIPGAKTRGDNSTTFWLEDGNADITNYKTGESKSLGSGEKLDVDADGNFSDVDELDDDDDLTDGWDETISDRTPPEIKHVSVKLVSAGEAVTVDADVTDDVGVVYAKLFYKVPSVSAFIDLEMTGGGEKFSATIPGAEVKKPELLYYIEASDGTNQSRSRTYAVRVTDEGDAGITACDEIDNDEDGKTDEEVANGVDDDGDGLIDEDVGCEEDANLSAPKLTSPSSGKTYCEPEIQVQGSVEGDLPLTVIVKLNDEKIGEEELKDSKNFSFSATLQNGDNEIVSYAQDDKGNISQSVVVKVTGSLEAPAAPTLDVIRKGGRFVRVEGTSGEKTTVNIALNGTNLGNVSTGDDGGYEMDDIRVREGRNAFSVFAIDNCGNKSEPVVKDLFIEEESPFTITAPKDKDCISQDPVKLETTFDPSQAPEGRYLVAIVNGEEQSDIFSLALTPGPNVIKAIVKDENDEGYRLNSSNAVPVVYDITPPEVTIDQPQDGLLTNGQNCAAELALLEGSVLDMECGVDEVTIKAGSEKTLTFGGKHEVNLGINLLGLLKEGENMVTVEATDVAGHKSMPAPPLHVILDRTPPNVSIGTINFNVVGPTIIIREEPATNPVQLASCPGTFHLRLSVEFPQLVANIPVSVTDNRTILGVNDYCPDQPIGKIFYNVIETEGELSMPPSNVEIKNIEILQSGSVDVYAYDDAGNRSPVVSEPIIAQKRVTVNGKTLLETSPGIFEDDINVPGASTLEIEAFWLVNGTKYGSFIDQSLMIKCQDIPPAPPY